VTAKRWFLDKVIFSLIVIAAFYIVGETYGVVPQPMKETVGWFGQNFESILWFAAFVIACYVVLRVFDRKKGRASAN